MDNNIIYERLKALGGGIEQEQYRDISQVFEEVIRYNKNALETLQNQLRDELRDVSQRYYLYGTVVQRTDASIVNDFLFPLCEEPEKPENETTVFCQCSLSEMERLFQETQQIIIETEQGEYKEKAHFRPCRRYFKEVEALREIYFQNGLFWRTPYLPYLKRFADIQCDVFQELGEIQGLRLFDQSLELKSDVMPLWNVEKISEKCKIFPIPAIDEQHYRHSLKLPFVQDGYAVKMEPSVRNVFYQKEELVLITEDQKQRAFELYRIAAKREVSVPHYTLTTNKRTMRHIDRQAENGAVQLRTIAELSRIVSSYEVSKEYVLRDVKVGENAALILTFKIPEVTFLTADQTAFLVQEIQEYFPQFVVRGETFV